MPSPVDPHRLLDEVQGDLGFALWRVLTDAMLWVESQVPAHELFWTPSSATEPDHPELSPLLRVLSTVAVGTANIERGTLAGAAAGLWDWAEKRELRHTALLFAELAARFEPQSPERASTAGRLCRPLKDPVRGTRWYLRATRLARMANSDSDFAVAHLGWGNMESELGRLSKAEFHATKAFRAALRVGRHGLAASAYHDLLTIKIHTEKLADAWAYARSAVASYRVDHPRFPALAHDIAFLWGKLGYHSSSLPVYIAVLPTMKRKRERLIVLANIARAAAASHERLYFMRASGEILQAMREGYDVPATALYHLAHAYQTYEEWVQAEQLAEHAQTGATGRWKIQTERLIRSIAAREAGDRDLLPPDGGEVDNIREVLLRRLKRHGADHPNSGEVPPERYPIT